MLRLFIVKNFRGIPQHGWRTHGEGLLCGVTGGGAPGGDPRRAAHRRDSGRCAGRRMGSGMGKRPAAAWKKAELCRTFELSAMPADKLQNHAL